MKKYIALTALSVVLAGCQLTGGSDEPNLANADFANMSCSEIKTLFDDYKSYMDNADTTSDLMSAFSVDSSGVDQANNAMKTTYAQAKKVATPVMKLKKCTQII